MVVTLLQKKKSEIIPIMGGPESHIGIHIPRPQRLIQAKE